ncbi:Ig-like domain-containing protein [Bacillus sp. ISL-7]|uniref:Ig-like domain-containing protein n=1 Tax=Bacillus sp. ISL-7 TaxID=2819136 RepID=UPI001BEB5AA0|nr:Ig-like domain-containing protein [Bacillus sp. ISL-7]MBT2733622.1 hypothetical protein [Bacillus sp. ISL-7]
MKSLRMFFFLIVLMILAIPNHADGQEMKEVEKSLTNKLVQSITPGNLPKRSLSIKQSYNPADYSLKANGNYVDSLWDSYDTTHDIYFEAVSNYSASTMNVQIFDFTDYAYLKDSIVTIEFLKSNGGTLVYLNSLEFDTIGYTTIRLNSLVPKSIYQGQPYIYLRVGVSESIDDEYYSDVTQFKVKNPFYTAPVDKTPPSKPTVTTVSDLTTAVKGKAEAYSTVSVNRGSTTIGRGTALSNNTYSVTIPKQKAGTKLTVYARDRAGNLSSGATVTVIDKTAPGKPLVYSVGDNQNIIRGKAEAGSKVVMKQGSTVVGQTTASSTGYFTIKLTSIRKAGTIFATYATDRVGNRSLGTIITVVDKIPPTAPTVNKVTYASTKVTGKAEKSAMVYIFNGSTLVGIASSNTSGSFTAPIKAQKKGSTLEVISLDKARNQSKSTFSKVY